MSYNLMVFEKNKAPKTKKDFMEWYFKQTQWSEAHDYTCASITSSCLRNWFMEMKDTFPQMNGEYAPDDDLIDADSDLETHLTDYTIGHDVIYMAFGWSLAEKAYTYVSQLAQKHDVGFFDVSGNEDIIFPDGTNLNQPEPPKGFFSKLFKK